MTIDIFQYSNMYTLRKSIQWLADEAHVKEECGAYVAKPGRRFVLSGPSHTNSNLPCRKDARRLAEAFASIFATQTWYNGI